MRSAAHGAAPTTPKSIAVYPPRTAAWMGIAYVTSLIVAGVTLAASGAGIHGTGAALQMTGRWSFCFFWPAYTGAALATLFGMTFQALARRGRDFGLAFASAHLTHMCLVVWLYYISPRPPLPASSAIFFGIAFVLTYILALFSIPSLAAKLPARLWWALRTFGMDYIALAFLRDFLQHPFNGSKGHIMGYAPFALLALAAALLRLAAYMTRIYRKTVRLQPAA